MNKKLLLCNFINSICEDREGILYTIDLFKQNFEIIAKPFRIGRVFIDSESGITPIKSIADKNSTDLFRSEDCDMNKVKKFHYPTEGGGAFEITFNGIKGKKWTKENEMELAVLSNLVYTRLGKAKVSMLLNDVITTDPETKIPNMIGFHNFCKRENIRNNLHEYSFLFCNIKNFGNFCRTEGPQNSRGLIIAVNSFANSLRKTDEFVARPGGDNVVMLVKTEHLNSVLEELKNIHYIAKKGDFSHDILVDLWIGVCKIKPEFDIHTAIENASIALAYTKKSRNAKLVAFYTEELMKSYVREKELVSIFPKCLKNNEFVVYYQPKAAANDGKMIGAEGLVRWFHQGKLIPPNDFIPALEEDGLVIELDFFVLEKVCQDIKGWIEEGIEPVRISTNFSRDHFKNTDTAQRIIELLKKYNIDGKYIQVEITEMAGVEDVGQMISLINTLHDYGVTVAIDDFGIGYSSLNMLKDYEADIVKIDKSLLDDVGESEKAKKLLESIIKISRDVGMEVLIEGVEEKDQLEYVSRIGCDYVQGYYFDRPLPKQEFDDRLNDKQYRIE